MSSEQQESSDLPPVQGPLKGMKVVEAASWIAGPAAGRILRSLGADVVKIEPPTGDGLRGMANPARIPGVNPPFEATNAGKRSLVLDLTNDSARGVLREMLSKADVFLTNLSPGFLERHGLDFPALKSCAPQIVYCLVSAYGAGAVDRDRPGFDGAAFWAASGMGALMSQPYSEPVVPRAAMGDHVTAVAAVAAITLGLLQRAVSGGGQFVETSLRNNALFSLTWDVANLEWVGKLATAAERHRVSNPLNTSYRCGDDLWIVLVNLQSDRAWPGLCRALEADELAFDVRFTTAANRALNRQELIAILEDRFARWPRSVLGERLDAEQQLWAPLNHPSELLDDESLKGVAWQQVEIDNVERRLPAFPMRLSGLTGEAPGTVPELGQHTEDVLLELGLTWDRISRLRDTGAFG